MYIEKISQPATTYMRSKSPQRESFQDILNRALKENSTSRPPKIELSGLLVPFSKEVDGHFCSYKLETKTKDVFLALPEALVQIAKRLEWEEVTVKGYLDLNSNLFEVEKLTPNPIEDFAALSTGDIGQDLDRYIRTIDRRGKLEPALDYLAS